MVRSLPCLQLCNITCPAAPWSWPSRTCQSSHKHHRAAAGQTGQSLTCMRALTGERVSRTLSPSGCAWLCSRSRSSAGLLIPAALRATVPSNTTPPIPNAEPYSNDLAPAQHRIVRRIKSCASARHCVISQRFHAGAKMCHACHVSSPGSFLCLGRPCSDLPRRCSTTAAR
jgi:hypothetical protein